MTEPMSREEYVASTRAKVVSLARAMLEGKTSFLEGAIHIWRLHSEADVPERDPDFDIFVGIESSTDDLPIGAARKNWSAEALATYEPRIVETEAWARELATEACRSLIQRFEVYRYDEPALLAALQRLPETARTCFAVACAARTYVHSINTLGDESVAILRQALDYLLDSMDTDVKRTADTLALRDRLLHCEAIDDDAMAATTYALSALASGDPREAAYAARRAYDAQDIQASIQLDIDFNAPNFERRVLQHPAVQAELREQSADLSLLLTSQASPSDAVSIIAAKARESVRGTAPC
jgi:hypothetical protein